MFLFPMCVYHGNLQWVQIAQGRLAIQKEKKIQEIHGDKWNKEVLIFEYLEHEEFTKCVAQYGGYKNMSTVKKRFSH